MVSWELDSTSPPDKVMAVRQTANGYWVWECQLCGEVGYSYYRRAEVALMRSRKHLKEKH